MENATAQDPPLHDGAPSRFVCVVRQAEARDLNGLRFQNQ